MKTRWPRPDFLAVRQGPPRLAWLWAATGAVVLAITLVEGFELQRRLDKQRTRLENAAQRIATARPTRSVASASSAGLPRAAKANADAIDAAQRILAHLDHPWGSIVSSIEAETLDGIQWLVFDHDSDGPELRLEGISKDIASVLSLIDALSSRAGWSHVALSRLQAPDARETGNGAAWRFEIRASLDATRIASASNEAGR